MFPVKMKLLSPVGQATVPTALGLFQRYWGYGGVTHTPLEAVGRGWNALRIGRWKALGKRWKMALEGSSVERNFSSHISPLVN
jgi:hypothetical protein